MKQLISTVCCLYGFLVCFAQNPPVASAVYSPPAGFGLAEGKLSHTLFRGTGNVLSSMFMGLQHYPPKSSYTSIPLSNREIFMVIAKGSVAVKINDSSFHLAAGSIICVMPGDKLQIVNDDKTADIYDMQYMSFAVPDIERGRKAGGSFVVNWDSIPFKPHDKGGVRQFFDRPTAMLNRFDMHVTTLNAHNKSHDPHTHKNEEIILMLQGNAEMQIGQEHKKANAGDVIYLGSNVLHNLTNIGTVPCVYYAIQWN